MAGQLKHLESEALQFSFRTNHSTETAFCFFLESLKSSLDEGEAVGAVFLDLHKAFHTVNLEALLSKMTQFKLSIDTLIWLKSYLGGCSHCVHSNNAVSQLAACTIGVPRISSGAATVHPVYQ